MTEFDRDENNLEQRLQDHYNRSYAQPPASSVVWARIRPHLDERKEEETPGSRFTRSKQPSHPRLRHTVEAAIAVLVVASLLLGWFTVAKWRGGQGTGPTLFTYTSQPGERVYDSYWTPDGKHLMFVVYTVATNHYRYLVWDAATGKVRQTLVIDLPPAEIGRSIIDSPNGRYTLMRTYGATKQVWAIKLANILTGQTKLIDQQRYQGQDASSTPAVALSRDSKYAAFIGTDRRIHIWDIAASKFIQTTDSLSSGTAGSQLLVWSTDDKRLMVETRYTKREQSWRLQVWSAQSGHTLVNFVETPVMSLFDSLLELGGGFAGLSPDGTRLLTYNQQTGTFTERESSALKVLHIFSVHIGAPYFVFWEANGTRILLQSYETVFIWNASTGKLISTLSLKNSSQALLMPSGGRYLTRVQPGNLLEIWDMVTGTKVRTIALANSQVLARWSLDGKDLDLSDGNNGQIYDALSGHLITNYQGDGADLSPDGRYLATQKNLFDPQTNNFLQAVVQVLRVS